MQRGRCGNGCHHLFANFLVALFPTIGATPTYPPAVAVEDCWRDHLKRSRVPHCAAVLSFAAVHYYQDFLQLCTTIMTFFLLCSTIKTFCCCALLSRPFAAVPYHQDVFSAVLYYQDLLLLCSTIKSFCFYVRLDLP
jgi:hypothetical protein